MQGHATLPADLRVTLLTAPTPQFSNFFFTRMCSLMPWPVAPKPSPSFQPMEESNLYPADSFWTPWYLCTGASKAEAMADVVFSREWERLPAAMYKPCAGGQGTPASTRENRKRYSSRNISITVSCRMLPAVDSH